MIPEPNCKRCVLSSSRQRIISSYGPVPAKILVVTDPPNRTDELFNRPLAGPDGKVFTEMLKEAASIANRVVPSVHYISVTMCRPCENNLDRQAQKSEILKCMENVISVKNLCSPKLIVLMGEVSKNYYANEFEDPVFMLPCWFLRKNPSYWINAVSSLAEGILKCC